MTTAKELLARKYKRQPQDVPVLLDGVLAAELEAAQAAHDAEIKRMRTAAAGLVSTLPELEKTLAVLQAAADAETTVFTLASLPGSEYSALKEAHPPTDHQWEAYREQARAMPFVGAPVFDPEAMAPMFIAKSITHVDGDPVEWDAEDGQHLWDTLHDGARGDLLAVAYALSDRSSTRPKSVSGTDTTSSTAPSSTTPADTDSPYLSLAEGS